MQNEQEDKELNNPIKVPENCSKNSNLLEVLENPQEFKGLNQQRPRCGSTCCPAEETQAAAAAGGG